MLSKQDIQKVEEIVEEIVDRVVEEKLDRKMGVFIEHMNDQFQRIAEIIQVIDERTRQIPIVLRRLELAEQRLDGSESDIKHHDKRLKRLEAGQA